MGIALAVLVVTAAAAGFAFRPELAGTTTFWLSLAIPYAALSAFAVARMRADGALRTRLGFRSGDITLGALVGGLLLLCAWLVLRLIPPESSPAAWLLRLALQVGSAGAGSLAPLFILALAVMEEVVWRGLVLDALAPRFGTRRAWLPATLAYGLSHLPTVVTLSDPDAGPNPMLVAAALGAGGVWAFLASRLGRLPPVMVAHAVFGSFAPALLIPSLS